MHTLAETRNLLPNWHTMEYPAPYMRFHLYIENLTTVKTPRRKEFTYLTCYLSYLNLTLLGFFLSILMRPIWDLSYLTWDLS